LLSHRATVEFEVLEADKRPVSAVADSLEIRRVVRVVVTERRDIALTMLFDAGRSFEERVLAEQFTA
jgi:NAD+ kinase